MRTPSAILRLVLVAVSAGCSTAPPRSTDAADGRLPWGLQTRMRGSVHAEALTVLPTTVAPSDTVVVFVRLREGQRTRVDRIWGTISRGRPGGDAVTHGPNWHAYRWSDHSDADLWYVLWRAGGRMLVGARHATGLDLGDGRAHEVRAALGQTRSWLEELGIAVESEYEALGAVVAWMPRDPGTLRVVRSGPGITFVEAFVPGDPAAGHDRHRADYVGIVPPPPGGWNRMGSSQAVLAHINPNGSVRTAWVAVR